MATLPLTILVAMTMQAALGPSLATKYAEYDEQRTGARRWDRLGIATQ